MKFFIDTHSHIYYDEYKYDLPDIISKAEEADIGRIICVGTDIKTSYESIRISISVSLSEPPTISPIPGKRISIAPTVLLSSFSLI